MRQAAADRPSVSDLGMANERQRLGQQWAALGDQSRAFRCSLARHGADCQATVVSTDLADFRLERVDVNQLRRSSQAEIQQR